MFRIEFDLFARNVRRIPPTLTLDFFMVKSRPQFLAYFRFKTRRSIWRDGRAAEGACLENMFGTSQRGFESHSLRSKLQVGMLTGFQVTKHVNVQTRKLSNLIWGGARVVEWGRLLSGYWGEILSRRFESCPPRHTKTRPGLRRVFV